MKKVWKLVVILLLIVLCVPAQNVEAKTKYKTYGNGRFGYTIKYPSFFKQSKRLPDNSDGITMKGKGAELKMYGSYQFLYFTGKQMKKYRKESYPNAKFVKATKKECVYYYNEGSKQTYSYSYFINGKTHGIITYEMTYPKSKRKTFKKYWKTMTKSVKANKEFY